MDKRKIPTGALLRTFDRYTQALRNERPIFIRFKDGKLIKHALTHLTEFELEMLFWWFLANKKKMRPTIGAALCKEVVADFIRESAREYGFYTQIENAIHALNAKPASRTSHDTDAITAAFENLASSFRVSVGWRIDADRGPFGHRR